MTENITCFSTQVIYFFVSDLPCHFLYCLFVPSPAPLPPRHTHPTPTRHPHPPPPHTHRYSISQARLIRDMLQQCNLSIKVLLPISHSAEEDTLPRSQVYTSFSFMHDSVTSFNWWNYFWWISWELGRSRLLNSFWQHFLWYYTTSLLSSWMEK